MSSDPRPPAPIAWSRRDFLSAAGLAAAAAGLTPARAQSSQQPLSVGMIGCGGRGSWLGDLLREHGGYRITAAADYFRDRVDGFGERFEIPAARRFTGLSCYQRLLDSNVDAVFIISPPYFHPEQAAAAVAAGCHVFLAKPVAVDAPGCRAIARAGQDATAKGLTFLVDFQTRADPLYQEALRRVHDGALGHFSFGEASYHDERLGIQATPDGSPEARLRNWVFDQALSGDIITEQNIHALDVMNWIMNRNPLHAFGTGSRKVRVDVGDCWDSFTVHFQYPDQVGITFSSRQFAGHGSPGGIKNRMFGSAGVLETAYGGTVLIRGDHFYRGGSTGQIYRDGAVRNIADFHTAIAAGDASNLTVDPSVASNLVTILGRSAAYSGNLVHWDQAAASEERLIPDLDGLKT